MKNLEQWLDAKREKPLEHVHLGLLSSVERVALQAMEHAVYSGSARNWEYLLHQRPELFEAMRRHCLAVCAQLEALETAMKEQAHG